MALNQKLNNQTKSHKSRTKLKPKIVKHSFWEINREISTSTKFCVLEQTTTNQLLSKKLNAMKKVMEEKVVVVSSVAENGNYY